MAPLANEADGGQQRSARARRKAKEKANKRKRAAAGDVANPYAALEHEDEDDGGAGGDGDDVGKGDETASTNDRVNCVVGDEARPKTSGSDASGETLVGHHDAVATAGTPTSSITHPVGTNGFDNHENSRTFPNEWTFEELPDISAPSHIHDEDPDQGQPLTEAEARRQEIKDWLLKQEGHAWSFKARTADRIADFIYEMKYGRDRAGWMREVRLIVWRAAVSSNFWWTNPDTGETGRPAPVSAPAGVYEQNFRLFVACAAERLDRVGRDLPDPEWVDGVQLGLRLLFRRSASKRIVRPVEHLAFLLMVDEEQSRTVTREGFTMRMRMCFDGVQGMVWNGMGMVGMGEWPARKAEAPSRTEEVWAEISKVWKL